jgi:hypothetical protein
MGLVYDQFAQELELAKEIRRSPTRRADCLVFNGFGR